MTRRGPDLGPESRWIGSRGAPATSRCTTKPDPKNRLKRLQHDINITVDITQGESPIDVLLAWRKLWQHLLEPCYAEEGSRARDLGQHNEDSDVNHVDRPPTTDSNTHNNA